MSAATNPANFSNLPKEEVQALGSKGGHAAAGHPIDDTPTTSSSNPGNFANRPTEEVKAIASKGGQASAGFESWDKEKLVCY